MGNSPTLPIIFHAANILTCVFPNNDSVFILLKPYSI